MEFLAFWLGTSITSFCMEIANELRVFKDVADAGYKIDIRRMAELQDQLDPNIQKASVLSMVIPIFNIIQVFQKTIQYNNIRPMILDQLSILELLKEMSESEKQEYAKKPTGLNALLIPLRKETILKNANSIKIYFDNKENEIFYEIGDTLEDIKILKANGEISKLPIEEQKAKVIEGMKKIASAGLEKYKDKESFANELNNNTCIDLTNNDIEERKQNLETLKSELLNQPQQEKPKTLTKRK